jgi:hypothetical protein
MIKLVLTLIIGIGIGGAVGFYVGSDQTEKVQKEILRAQQESWEQQLKDCNECKDQKAKVEEQNKTLTTELQLNETRPFFVTSATLNAPEFSPPDLEALTSDKNGNISLNWSPVKGAKQYVVTVEDEEGKSISTTDVEGETSLYLNRITKSANLSTANYYVRIATINGLDQVGPQGPRKPIHFTSISVKASKKTKSKKR